MLGIYLSWGSPAPAGGVIPHQRLHLAASDASKDNKAAKTLPEVVCMPTASVNFSIDYKEIEDEDLPKYLPIVKEQDVKNAGGSCQSIPLCYDKSMFLLGLNQKHFK